MGESVHAAMTQEESARLEEIFRVVLDLPDGSDVSNVRRIATRRWDSLAHVSLIAAIESEFGLQLDTAGSERLTSFQAARLLIEELK